MLQFIKETAARLGELEFLKWSDINEEQRTAYITAEKGSNNRYIPISPKLIGMLQALQHNTDRVFPSNKHTMRTLFERIRDRTAKKLNNPRLRRIHCHTFRHWRATMEYHKTHEILQVQQLLGHKDIKSTLIYINLEQALFHTATDEWIVKTAKTIEESIKLLEVGFEHVTDQDGLKLYRKRK
jgi:integrase